jgi:hypothetical protein
MKRIAIIITVLFLIGCQSVESSQITLDTGMIKTEAVRTAIAEITVQAILNPTSPAVTLTSVPIPEAKEIAIQSTETPNFQEVEIPVEPVYACSIDQSASLPKDGPQPAGEKVEKIWVIRNSGNVAWNAENVKIKWVGGVNLCDQDCQDWSGQVKPGDEYTLKIDLTMPSIATNKVQIVEWGLVNPANEIFCKLYYLIPNVY